MISETDVVKEKFEELLQILRTMKDTKQGSEARALAVTITELEKAYAYCCIFCVTSVLF